MVLEEIRVDDVTWVVIDVVVIKGDVLLEALEEPYPELEELEPTYELELTEDDCGEETGFELLVI